MPITYNVSTITAFITAWLRLYDALYAYDIGAIHLQIWMQVFAGALICLQQHSLIKQIFYPTHTFALTNT